MRRLLLCLVLVGCWSPFPRSEPPVDPRLERVAADVEPFVLRHLREHGIPGVWIAVLDEAVGQAEEQHVDLAPGEGFENRAARAAHDLVLLDRDDQLVRAGQLAHEVGVDETGTTNKFFNKYLLPMLGVPDGVVNDWDYNFWRANFGAAGMSAANRSTTTVPEGNGTLPLLAWVLVTVTRSL